LYLSIFVAICSTSLDEVYAFLVARHCASYCFICFFSVYTVFSTVD